MQETLVMSQVIDVSFSSIYDVSKNECLKSDNKLLYSEVKKLQKSLLGEKNWDEIKLFAHSSRWKTICWVSKFIVSTKTD